MVNLLKMVCVQPLAMKVKPMKGEIASVKTMTETKLSSFGASIAAVVVFTVLLSFNLADLNVKASFVCAAGVWCFSALALKYAKDYWKERKK